MTRRHERGRRPRPVGRVLAGWFAAMVATAFAVALAGARPAHAHAELDDSVPRAGAVLEAAPAEVVLDFDEALVPGLSYAGLFDPDGAPVALGNPIDTPDRTQFVVPLRDPASLGAGAYVVAYRVTAVDGHVHHASFAFQVGTRTTDQVAAVERLRVVTDVDDAGWQWLAGVLRALGLVALALVVAAIAVPFLVPAPTPRTRTVGSVAAAVAAAVAVLGIGAQGGLSGSGGAGAFVDGDRWSAVLDTRLGALLVARAALALAALSLFAAVRSSPGRAWRWSGALVGVGLVLTHSLAGHAALGRLAAAGVVLDAVHLGVALVWLGGLALMVLDRALYSGGRLATLWAKGTFGAAAMVVVTGVLQVWRIVERPGSLLDTAYGRTVLGKTVLVALILLLMAMGRSAYRRLGLSAVRSFLAVETALALLLVGVSAGLIGAAPNERPTAVPVTVSATVDGVTVTFTLTPAAVGSNDVHLVVSRPAAFEPTRAARAVLDNPGRGLTSLVIPLSPDGPDHYSAYAVQIPSGGAWDVRIEVDDETGTTVLSTSVEVTAD